MPDRIQISCIGKTPRDDPWDRIAYVGGSGPGGSIWKLDLDMAIAGIEEGSYAFYVSAGGNAVDVIVATHSGHTYLKTTADGDEPDNLLSLPECP